MQEAFGNVKLDRIQEIIHREINVNNDESYHLKSSTLLKDERWVSRVKIACSLDQKKSISCY